MKKKKLNELIAQLPPELKQEVEDFVVFLSDRYQIKAQANKFQFEWEGSLEEWNQDLDCLALQRAGMELWEDNDVFG